MELIALVIAAASIAYITKEVKENGWRNFFIEEDD